MYNKRLNDACLNGFRKYCKDKRVLLVGNSASLFEEERGDFIDSFDVVVRFGKGVPTEDIRKHVGSKTEVWFTGALRMPMWKEWTSAKWRIYHFGQRAAYDDTSSHMDIPKCVAFGEFQVYDDFFMAGSPYELLDAHREIYGKKGDGSERPSQGILAMHFFVNTVKTQSELHCVGFDFGASTLRYSHMKQPQGYALEHIVGSWHMPMLSSSANKIPHGSPQEKAFAERLESERKLTIHRMQPLSAETAERLLGVMRKGAKLHEVKND